MTELSKPEPFAARLEGLLALPPEIRETVYEAAMSHLPREILLRDWTSPTKDRSLTFPAVLPRLCFTNKQIYDESVAVFIRDRKFTLGSSYGAACLDAFLARLPCDQGFRWVRRLYVESYVYGINISELLHHCTHIQHLVVEANITDILDVDRDGGEFAYENIWTEEEIANGEFCKIPWLSSQKLKSVKLVCHWPGTCSQDQMKKFFDLLVTYLKKEIEKKGLKTEMQVEYLDRKWFPYREHMGYRIEGAQ